MKSNDNIIIQPNNNNVFQAPIPLGQSNININTNNLPDDKIQKQNIEVVVNNNYDKNINKN